MGLPAPKRNILRHWCLPASHRGERHRRFADMCGGRLSGSCRGWDSTVRARGIPAEPAVKAEAAQAVGRARGAPACRCELLPPVSEWPQRDKCQQL